MLEKERTKWDVYLIEESPTGVERRFVSSTYAYTRKKAVSNVRYRTKIKDTERTDLKAFPA